MDYAQPACLYIQAPENGQTYWQTKGTTRIRLGSTEGHAMSRLTIDRRLSALEQTTNPTETVHVWLKAGMTVDQVIAERFPCGLRPDTKVIAYRWQADVEGPKGL